MRESDPTILNAATAEQMRGIGAALAQAIQSLSGAPVVIAIHGELGAGKTTLVGGLLNSLGHAGPVRSPTYTLIEPYELAGRSIQHLDLYRLADPAEVEALGVRDLLTSDAVLLMEWPERGGDFVPPPDLRLIIQYAAVPESGRNLQFAALTTAGIQLKNATMRAIKP